MYKSNILTLRNEISLIEEPKLKILANDFPQALNNSLTYRLHNSTGLLVN
jgi:hypothetical protein